MRISEYNPLNVNRFTGKINDVAKTRPYNKLGNTFINVFCGIYDRLKGDRAVVKKKRHRGKPFIWQKNKNVDEATLKGRCVIFASHSSTNTVEDYVVYYLRQLAKISDHIVFIMSNGICSEKEISKIEKYVDCAIFENHGGYDFGSWKRGLDYLSDKKLLGCFDSLILANDSCYGPIYPLEPIFSEMDSKNCDFWGLVDSKDIRYHILSFFMVFKKNVFNNSYFSEFFNNLPESMTPNEAIIQGECMITEYLSRKFTPMVYRSGLCDNSKSIKGGNRNITLWPVTCLNSGIPLIKVKAVNGIYGAELNEGISDSLNIIKNINPELYSIIINDLKRRNTKSEDWAEFDGFSTDIRELIKKKLVVSFDVFDTLLNRPFASPVDLYISIARDYDAPSFTEERINAEKKAREKHKNYEITLDEIYKEISPEFRSYKEIELKYEYDVLHTNPHTYKMYTQAVEDGKKIICISDMYLPSKFIKEVLLKNGYDAIDHVFVSCEYRENKGLGKLYDIVLDELGIQADDIIHFGDNFVSDYSVPKKLQISAHHIPKIIDRFIQNPSNIKYSYFFQNNLTVPASIHLALCSEYRYLEPDSCSFWEDLGYCVGGPLALSYVNFISKLAVSSNIDKLFFVARDGDILKDIYEKHFKNDVEIECEYVYLTRHVGLTSLLDYFEEPTYISAILNAAKDQIPEITVNSAFGLNKSVYKQHYEELKKWSERSRTNLINHITAKAGGSSSIGIVDMTTQYMSSYRFAKILLENRIKLGIFTGTFKENPDLEYVTFSKRILNSSDDPILKMSELLISSSEAPILSIDENGDPIYGEDIGAKSHIYEDIRRGVLSYCENFIKYFGIKSNNMMSWQEWENLSWSYINHCNHIDLYNLSEIYDTPSVDNASIAVKFSDSIKATRGY